MGGDVLSREGSAKGCEVGGCDATGRVEVVCCVGSEDMVAVRYADGVGRSAEDWVGIE